MCLIEKQTQKTPTNNIFSITAPLNLKEHFCLSTYFKVNYFTDKEPYSKLSKNVSSPQVSPLQLLIFILIICIDAYIWK